MRIISCITDQCISVIYEEYRTDGIFGRSNVQKTTGLGGTRAYELIKALLEIKVIEAVSGHGKGKYKFVMLNKSLNK